MKPFGIRFLLAGAAVIALAGMPDAARAGFYDGKNINMIINVGAGGGLTRAGRAFARVMQKHLGADTNLVIKNLPGGGGIRGLNFMAEKAKNDGLTIMWGTSNPLAKLLKRPGVRYDLADFNVIGVGSHVYVSIIRSDAETGLKKAADVLKMKKLIVGGRGATDGLGLFARIALDVLNVNYRYVPGYRGQPKLNAALRAKEINLLVTGQAGYAVFYENTILKTGEALALFYHSPIDQAGNPQRMTIYPPKVKNFVDFYRETHGGKKPSGAMWEAYRWISTYNTFPFGMFAPKGTDPAKVAELRIAFKKTTIDPEFKKAIFKQFKYDPTWFVGKEADWLKTNYLKISSEGLAGLKKLTKSKKKKGKK